mmetsp:Transcript_66291/g.181798  ORF Transcript_66291/g.181798 Transcript_66291/m.181798 type:complete len:167 (+) Transcript_66291:125-625(+)
MFGLLTITAIALNTTDKASSSILSEVAAALAVDANATAPFYIGCYRDCISGTNCDKRDLPVFWCSNGKDGLGDCAADSALPAGASAYASGSAMTMATCSGMCTGFKFFGLQAGGECYCGDDYGNAGGKKEESECNMACTGDASEICGGGGHNSIYAQPPSTGKKAK